jgi:hypothetical protein
MKTWILSLGMMTVLLQGLYGCAQSGSINVSGQGAFACTGSVTQVISPSISLGNAVAKAAAQAAETYMKAITPAAAAGAAVQATQKKAVDTGVNAGIQEATKQGMTVTPQEQEELRQALQTAVQRSCGG